MSNLIMNIQTISEVVAHNNSWLPHPTDEIAELLYDSRRLLLPEQSLFFAIKTENGDGHAYIDSLVNAGVRNFIVSQSADYAAKFPDCNFICVNDSVLALQQLVAAHRSQFGIPVVGITGSNGKTIVKEWIAQMLSDDFAIVASPNSYNSQIGVPMSVWQLQGKHQLAVFEAGISKPGEMSRLESVIRPTIGILTNIGAAHDQFFPDLESKLLEKLKLFKHCSKLIYNFDNQLIKESVEKNAASETELLSWGRNPEARYVIADERVAATHTSITLSDNEFLIPFVDAASIENALQIIVLMLDFGFSAAQINHKLTLLSPVEMRLEVKQALNDSIVINDTYSLDFNSLQVALDFLQSQVRYERKTVVLSDFEQAGALSRADYVSVARMLTQKGVSRLLAVGRNLRANADCFAALDCHFFADTSELLAEIGRIDSQNEAVLVKGARSFGFERVVERLRLRTHRTVLSVSLPALVNNLNYYRSLVSPQTKIVAMVKAMCYGLGDVELINELQYHHIDYLAVAYTDEGVNLRKKNIRLPIIVLGAEGESFEMMLQYNLEPEIFNFYSLQEFEKALALHPELRDVKIHLKIDTGMHRLGFRKEDVAALVAHIQQNPQLKVASIFSHLAAAEDETQDAFTLSQIAYFEEVSSMIRERFDYLILRHIDNTAGISRFPQAHFDMVRVGIGLYGFTSVAADQPHLQHVATLKTIVTHVREIAPGETVGYNRTFTAGKTTRVGIIPLGYADGFPPELGRGVGTVVVRGRHVPIIGKICMDMAMIDLSGMQVAEGEEVIVYGTENRIDDVAAKIGKIPYHLLTSVSKRVQRVYVVD